MKRPPAPVLEFRPYLRPAPPPLRNWFTWREILAGIALPAAFYILFVIAGCLQ